MTQEPNVTKARFDEVDVQGAVSTGELLGTYPGQIRAIANGEVVASIDPSNTTTPVDDARAAIRNNADSGRIELPGQPVEQGVTLGDGVGRPLGGIQIAGPAVKQSTPTQGTSAELHYTSSGSTDDQAFDFANGDAQFGLENVIVRGPGQGLTTGPAIDFSGNHRGLSLNQVYIVDWSDSGITTASGGLPFEMDWAKVQITNCDGIPLNITNAGPGNDVDLLKLNPDGSEAAVINAGVWDIDVITVGGSVSGGFGVGAALQQQASGARNAIKIGAVNYEPASQSGVSKVFTVRDRSVFKMGLLSVQSAVDYAYGLNVSPGHKHLGRVDATSNGNLNTNAVDVQDTPQAACEYDGIIADMDNNTGSSLSQPNTVYGLDGALS